MPTIDVHNVLGQKVNTLIPSPDAMISGDFVTYSVTWDGTDFSGRAVSSGVYFYRIQAGDMHQQRKMVMMK